MAKPSLSICFFESTRLRVRSSKELGPSNTNISDGQRGPERLEFELVEVPCLLFFFNKGDSCSFVMGLVPLIEIIVQGFACPRPITITVSRVNLKSFFWTWICFIILLGAGGHLGLL